MIGTTEHMVLINAVVTACVERIDKLAVGHVLTIINPDGISNLVIYKGGRYAIWCWSPIDEQADTDARQLLDFVDYGQKTLRSLNWSQYTKTDYNRILNLMDSFETYTGGSVKLPYYYFVRREDISSTLFCGLLDSMITM